jgi:hypothetical protein
MGQHHRLYAVKRSVQRLARGGWTLDAIARLYQLPRADVARLIASPPARAPRAIQTGRKQIAGRLGPMVRERAAAGQSASEIAETCNLDPADVQDYLDRWIPRRGGPLVHPRRYQDQIRPPRPPGQPKPIDPERLAPRGKRGPLSRPRYPCEQRALSEWSRLLEEDDLVGVEPEIRAEMVPSEGDPDRLLSIAAMSPREDWGSWHANAVGDRAPLLGDDIGRLRELRAAGWTHRRLAGEFGVSVSTVKRRLAAVETMPAVELLPVEPPAELPAGPAPASEASGDDWGPLTRE